MLDTYITEPGKLVRITTMARALLEEARSTPCDAAGCERLRRIHDRVIAELTDVISIELHEELLALAVQFDQASPTPSEVRIAQAELVGWLEGLMAGMVVMANTEATTPQTPTDIPARLDETEAPGLYL
ncbi:MAG: proteasome activator [Acidimicrobiia bacterium]